MIRTQRIDPLLSYDDTDLAIFRAVHTHDGGRLIGVGGFIKAPGDVVAFDITTGQRVAAHKDSQISLSSLAISPDDRLCVTSGSSSDRLSCWSLEEDRHVRDVIFLPKPHRKSSAGHLIAQTHISDLRFTPSGTTVVMSCWDCSVKLVNLRDENVHELSRHRRNNFEFVGVSPMEDYIVCGTTTELQMWDFASRSLRCVFNLEAKDHWTHLFLPSLKTIASVSQNGHLHFWQVETNTHDDFRLYDKLPVTALAFSASLGLLAIGQADGRIILWDLAQQSVAKLIAVDDATIMSMDFSPKLPVLSIIQDSDRRRVLDIGA